MPSDKSVSRAGAKGGFEAKAATVRSFAAGLFTDAQLRAFQEADRDHYATLRVEWDSLLKEMTTLLAKVNAGEEREVDALRLDRLLQVIGKVRPTLEVLAKQSGVRTQAGETRQAKAIADATSKTDAVKALIEDFNT